MPDNNDIRNDTNDVPPVAPLKPVPTKPEPPPKQKRRFDTPGKPTPRTGPAPVTGRRAPMGWRAGYR